MTKEEKCKATQIGRITIHLNDEEKKIYLDELDFYLNLGWQKGMSEKHIKKLSEKHKGKPSWNKGTKGLMKSNKGSFKKGQKAWNKGIKKITIDNKTKETIIKKYINNKKTVNEIGKLLNISTHYIYEILHNENLIRSNSESKKGHITSQETKNKISKANTGHKVSDKQRKRFSEYNKSLTKEQIQIKVTKAFLTKKLNNSFNVSQPEKDLYEKLLKENVNKTILKQYKDPERYPFYCDFYIVEDDLFIELNAHWTHGGHPFDPNNEDDLKTLEVWKEKAKTSKFFQTAIEVWTIRDPKKLQCAKEHNLNYKVIY